MVGVVGSSPIAPTNIYFNILFLKYFFVTGYALGKCSFPREDDKNRAYINVLLDGTR